MHQISHILSNGAILGCLVVKEGSENGEGERGQPLPHLPGPDQRGGTTTPSSVSQRFTFFHAAS